MVDSTANSIRKAQIALNSAAPSSGPTGQPAPYASTPLTSLSSFTTDKEDVSSWSASLATNALAGKPSTTCPVPSHGTQQS